MNICVIGTGYVGLVTGTCFAEMGNKVWCVDVDNAKIEMLNKGISPIYEPGLKEMIERNSKNGRLKFTTDIKEGIESSLYCFIAVGTPPGEDGSSDITNVLKVAGAIGQNMNKYTIIINKSTVPVGTGEKTKELVREELRLRNELNIDFDVVSNPEFLKEGAAIEDFMRPDRIIIGTDNPRTAELMKQLYEPFVRNQHPILIMDIKSAELTKYAANSMLAARISFMNEIARLCDITGADVNNVRVGMGMDSRIGMAFLYAGTGYGGSCFPKDIKELISLGSRNGLEMKIAKAVEEVNESQKHYLVNMVTKRFGCDLKDMSFGIWGLAFKPQTDDMREAPSLVIMKELTGMGANIIAYDPEAIEQSKCIMSEDEYNIKYVYDMMEAIDKVDALILVTEWRQFRQPDFREMKSRMKQSIVFDGRNQYDTIAMQENGWEYYCIGRNTNVK
ncbi:MAG TPA: UDP-glucose/GDP-mannose dehydrogenase family protein [Bacillota bacterium]|nr:UDP-glucose/GDP-mannose dehydrogenase family protein [Bacillota bacterium]HPX68273.1 UDP-glucose/GDP-mannose dehydrogenase family protein [Bacillota bacterium]HQO42937.1 UDP-glucose/GDP-mannose dehydrogenase family protein [Bacillota bacterium]HQQ44139.1 UDP-glucose/GDP-mannose dehydrogenase family protein [Bacillota bacterium]